MVAAQFLTVGSKVIFLSEIQPTVTEDASLGDLIIKILDSQGYPTSRYYWDPLKNEWLNENGENTNTVTFNPGQALWIQGWEDMSLQTSGFVKSDETEIILNEGHTAVANPYPTNINIQDIFVSGAEDADIGDLILKVLGNDGYADLRFYYDASHLWTYKGESRTGAWLDDAKNLADYLIPAGQGMWVQGWDSMTFVIDTPTGL